MASKFFFKPFITVPVAPVLTGTIAHFIFHTRISIHKFFIYYYYYYYYLLNLRIVWTYFTGLLYIRASLLRSVCTVTVGTHVLVSIAGLLVEF